MQVDACDPSETVRLAPCICEGHVRDGETLGVDAAVHVLPR